MIETLSFYDLRQRLAKIHTETRHLQQKMDSLKRMEDLSKNDRSDSSNMESII